MSCFPLAFWNAGTHITALQLTKSCRWLCIHLYFYTLLQGRKAPHIADEKTKPQGGQVT